MIANFEILQFRRLRPSNFKPYGKRSRVVAWSNPTGFFYYLASQSDCLDRALNDVQSIVSFFENSMELTPLHQLEAPNDRLGRSAVALDKNSSRASLKCDNESSVEPETKPNLYAVSKVSQHLKATVSSQRGEVCLKREVSKK